VVSRSRTPQLPYGSEVPRADVPWRWPLEDLRARRGMMSSVLVSRVVLPASGADRLLVEGHRSCPRGALVDGRERPPRVNYGPQKVGPELALRHQNRDRPASRRCLPSSWPARSYNALSEENRWWTAQIPPVMP
jgi:hypothetical protein